MNVLHIAAELGVQWLYIRDNSKLVINRVTGESNCRDPRIAAYHQRVRRLEDKFNGFELHHILRCDNEVINTLTRLGSNHGHPPPGVFIQDLIEPSIRLDEDDPTPVSGT
jgi:hypothetical protein